MSEPETVIEAVTSAHGKRRWTLTQRPDGLFLYSEETFVILDERNFGGAAYEVWKPSHGSGVYASAEEAKTNAMRELPWLRNAASPA